jgi:hypothetical protein
MSERVSAVSYSASGFLTVVAAINIEYILMGLGLLIAALTFFMNWYFKRREDKRAVNAARLKCEAHTADQRRKDELHKAQLVQLNKDNASHIRS